MSLCVVARECNYDDVSRWLKKYINIKIFDFKLNFSSYILANNYILIRVINITKYLKKLQSHFNKTLDHCSRMAWFVEKRYIRRIYKKKNNTDLSHLFTFSFSIDVSWKMSHLIPLWNRGMRINHINETLKISLEKEAKEKKNRNSLLLRRTRQRNGGNSSFSTCPVPKTLDNIRENAFQRGTAERRYSASFSASRLRKFISCDDTAEHQL